MNSEVETSIKASLLEVQSPPFYIYSFTNFTHNLHRTQLATGNKSTIQIPSTSFFSGDIWTDVPQRGLYLTGREFRFIEVRRDFAVVLKEDMRFERGYHGAVYHASYLYVFGGQSSVGLIESCERYCLTSDCWEVICSMPHAASDICALVDNDSIYSVGIGESYFVKIQRLDVQRQNDLQALQWEVLKIKLPYFDRNMPFFKVEDRMYLILMRKLCSFTASSIQVLKDINSIVSSIGGPSYYFNGTLYCSSIQSPAFKVDLSRYYCFE